MTIISSSLYSQPFVADSIRFKTGNTNWTETVTYTRPNELGEVHDVTYYNGLGYPMQTINVRASGPRTNIVTRIEYDLMRQKEAKVYLPTASSDNTGRMYPNLPSTLSPRQDNTYPNRSSGSNQYDYIETIYDNSPLNRIGRTIQAGTEYREPELKAAIYEYDVCAAGEVMYLKIEQGTYPSLVVDGYYPKGTLLKNSITDEDGTTTHTFTDSRGNTLLTRVETSNGPVETYYVYDFADRLAWVVTPEGAALLTNNSSYAGDSKFARDYCYYYTYNADGNVLMKHLPGRDNNEYFMYDDKGRLEKHCDGNYTYTHLAPMAKSFGGILLPGDTVLHTSQSEYLTHHWTRYEYDEHNRVSRQWYYTAKNDPDYQRDFFSLDSLIIAEYRYDRYDSIPSELAFVATDSVRTYASDVRGSKTYERLEEIGADSSSTYRYGQRAFYYDRFGRLCQYVELTSNGNLLRQSYSYDFSGNAIREEESVWLADRAAPDVKLTVRTFDDRNRPLSELTSLNGSIPAEVHYVYDNLGRLSTAKFGKQRDDGMHELNPLEERYTYTLQGRLKRKYSPNRFKLTLRYTDAERGVPSYTGQISEMEWGDGLLLGESSMYAFRYDELGRLIDADLYEQDSLTQRFTEREISYDRNGNTLAMTRTDNGTPTVFDYEYNGSRLHRITERNQAARIGTRSVDNSSTFPGTYLDVAFPIFIKEPSFSPYPVVKKWTSFAQNTEITLPESDTCRYDVIGNMTYEPMSGLRLRYNRLNLLAKVSRGDTVLANYSYLSDGTKRSAVGDDGRGFVYLGSLVYRISGDSLSLESCSSPGGRLVAQGPEASTFLPYYFLTDHLGSVRVVVAESHDGDQVLRTTLERNDYYPFGSRWEDPESLLSDNRYRYNGKEEQAFVGLPYIDYGARQLLASFHIWLTQDPLAEKYYAVSPYAFCAGNPIRYMDPNGEKLVITGTNEEMALLMSALQKLTNYQLYVNSDGVITHSIIKSENRQSEYRYGNELIEFLCDQSETAKTTTIKLTEERSKTVYVDEDEAYNGIGHDATVLFNSYIEPEVPTLDTETQDRINKATPTYIVMSHELIHAARHNRGIAKHKDITVSPVMTVSGKTYIEESIPLEDAITVGLRGFIVDGPNENRIRAEHGLEERLFY